MSDAHKNGTDASHTELPKLPVPDLNETFETYLDHLVPIVSKDEYDQATELVKQFLQDLGPRLQERLHERYETTENWMYDFWMTDMYMRSNLPLPINSNPGMITERQEFRDFDGQIRFTSRLILAVLNQVKVLEVEGLPVDKYKSHGCDLPLCMDQYYRLFRSYRYPGTQFDRLHTFAKYSRHIILAYKNQFFSIDVSREDLSEDELVTVLNSICRYANQNKAPVPIGVFTSDSRRRWGRIRDFLAQDPVNRQSLEQIETSICVICLDEGLPTMFNQNPRIRKYRDDSNMLVQMLHGGGSKYFGTNRWYDKTVQFIISSDGVVGLNYEHSSAEGIVVIELVDRIMKDVKSIAAEKKPFSPRRRTMPAGYKKGFKPLKWSTSSDEIDLQICQSLDHLDRLVQDLEYVVMKFGAFGKEYIKSSKISPDCFVQLALQLTFYKTHRMLVATYESAAIRRFLHGRVDVIRSASKEAYAWVKSMCGPNNDSITEKKELFDKAIKQQTEHMIKVISGRGMDNHMLALCQLAHLEGLETPQVFSHKSYQTFQSFRLSTSQVTSTVLPVLGYGPVVPDGYGAAYNIQPDHIIFNISAFNDDEDTCADFFASSLESSLLQMRELLMAEQIQNTANGIS